MLNLKRIKSFAVSRKNRTIALRLFFILFLVAGLILPSIQDSIGSEPSSDKTQTKIAEREAVEQKSGEKLQFKDWLAFFGVVGAALIAGGFAVYQLRRSTAAQRDLEREKLITARKEAELAQTRSARKEYQQAQVLPFLEQLDKTLIESYAVAHFPPYFPDLGGYIPQLRRHADKAMSEWLIATQEMSRHRMQLLLVLNQDTIETVTSLLTKFVDLMQDIINTRNLVWFKQASSSDLWEVQRAYVRTGYRLMLEIKEAAISMPKDEPPLLSEKKEELAEALTMPFEKASVVSIPYGSSPDFSWVAIWEIDTSPEWRQFYESMSHSTHEEFNEMLKALTKELYDKGEFLDVQMSRVVSGSLQVTCLAVKLSSEKRLQEFLETGVAKCRENFTILWSSHRPPIEITVGIDK